MLAGIVCHRGAERLCLEEAHAVLGTKGGRISFPGYVVVECGAIEDIAILSYRMQSATRVLLHISEGKDGNIDHIASMIETDIEASREFREILSSDAAVAIDCERMGTHPFNSSDVVQAIGDIIRQYGEQHEKELRPVFKGADISCYMYIFEDRFGFGIDFCGFDLSKRSYKIFAHQQSIKGTLAYCALRFAEYTEHDTIAVPFCQDGVVAIESILALTHVSPHRYDQNKFSFVRYPMFANSNLFDDVIGLEQRKKVPVYGFAPSFNHLQATQKNAKIAGIHKYGTFSKVDSDWLFTKFENHKADVVICHLPTRFQYRKDSTDKIYSEFFSELPHIIHPQSRIIIITTKPDVVKKTAPCLQLVSEMEVFSHKSPFTFLYFRPDNANVNK
jgi:23S rRNA G2445 N2-methylase RlmL